MNFTTKIPLGKSDDPIDYDSEILSLGSCFAENMGGKFDYFKFRNAVNPFGIIFNPVSIERLVSRIATNEKFTGSDVFFHNDLWHCYEVHSELSHPDKEIYINRLNQILDGIHNQIGTMTHCLITYGTSWVYRDKASGKIVANCHKVPQNQFDKEILSAATIEKSIESTIALVQKINPGCCFIFTVSPVRHIKDGFVENQRSKAHLIAALHSVISHQPSSVSYFPSYEIMMDELRDYRFYAEDMLHPNSTAINYIWERFSENHILGSCFATMDEIDSIQKALKHRPFNPDSSSHQKFLASLKAKIAALQQQFPHFGF
ncbi:MAG: GSCFA domain-containing protein [Flavobacterium sp.]